MVFFVYRETVILANFRKNYVAIIEYYGIFIGLIDYSITRLFYSISRRIEQSICYGTLNRLVDSSELYGS